MAEAIRRMLGQGLQPFGRSKAWWRETLIAPAAGGARCAAAPATSAACRQSCKVACVPMIQ